MALAFSWPVAGVVPARLPRGYLYGFDRGNVNHPGVDMGHLNDVVRAAASGTVTAAGPAAGAGGVLVYITHPDNYQTRYFHMNPTLTVTRGQTVVAGDPLGLVGTTGIKYSPAHLHFEIRKLVNGVWATLDPLKLLPKLGAGGAGLLAMAAVATGAYYLLRAVRG